MPNLWTPQASRQMLLDTNVALWATDRTGPFAALASGYVASTRTLTCSANPPDATPFTTTKVKATGGDMVHIGFSTSSVLPIGDYEIESRTSDTAVVLKADPRLPSANVAAVRGYVYQRPAAGITGGGTVLAAQKECSFMFDGQAFIVDGIEFTVVTAATCTLTVYAADGATVLYTKEFPSGTVAGSVYPVGAANGFGALGGFAASLGVASNVYSARLLFRPATPAEISGVYFR